TNNPLKPIRIEGPWAVRFPFGWGAPQRSVFPDLIDWIESEDRNIRHFSGVAVYHNSFQFSKISKDDSKIILDLGTVEEVARIYLNGRLLGIQSFSPFRVDVTDVIKNGDNYLVIEVANLMHNQMVGDASRTWEEKRTHSNITKGPNPWTTPWKDLPLKSSGLLGPVRIVFE
ncbi:glycosylhydrolase-like jelly roll fold domain-containing protein, partial [bacterium]